MPRRNRNPGIGKPPHNGKASLMPASGMPAMGEGYGGPANGAGASRIQPGDPDGITRMNRGKDVQDARREKVLAMWEAIVDDDQAPPMARITAGDKLLDRIDGKPVQTNVNLGGDDLEKMTDDELRAERARVDAALREARAARAAAGNPSRPDDVVH